MHFYNPSNIISGKSSQGVTIRNIDGWCPFTLSTTLTKYWITYKIPAGGNSTRNIIIPRLYGLDGTETEKGTGKITVQWEKLEEGNIATDWTPAPEDAIAQVDVEYYLSDSSTSLSGGSWTTLAPTWVDGKFMWSRTVTTDGVGNKAYSPNQNGVCIAGATGNTGATGKGIKSIGEEYYKSTSATSLTGGAWDRTYPGWENGKYIWTRSVTTYTDNTTDTTTPICVTGEKGADGKDGISPTVSVSKSGNTTTISITDKTGTHTQTVKDGTNGTPGTPGSDGRTPYIHVKYSDDGGKTFTSNSGETVGDYIGICTDYKVGDPGSVSSYTWAKIKGNHPEGAMEDGWVLDGRFWYYLNPTSGGPRGSMSTGLITSGDFSYYCRPTAENGYPEGSMITGWKLLNNGWYYFNVSNAGFPYGAMLKNTWVEDNGKKYFMKEDGKMAKSESVCIGRFEYTFSKSGTLENTIEKGE